jgi:hypothetical protein
MMDPSVDIGCARRISLGRHRASGTAQRVNSAIDATGLAGRMMSAKAKVPTAPGAWSAPG